MFVGEQICQLRCLIICSFWNAVHMLDAQCSMVNTSPRSTLVREW